MAVLLLLTCVDMLSPQACTGEVAGLPPAVVHISVTGGEHASPSERHVCSASENHDGSGTEHADEDCFCCCSHLLVGTRVTLDGQPVGSAPESLPRVSFPASPSESLYRPPRVS